MITQYIHCLALVVCRLRLKIHVTKFQYCFIVLTIFFLNLIPSQENGSVLKQNVEPKDDRRKTLKESHRYYFHQIYFVSI